MPEKSFVKLPFFRKKLFILLKDYVIIYIISFVPENTQSGITILRGTAAESKLYRQDILY